MSQPGTGERSIKRLRSATQANAYQKEWFAGLRAQVAQGLVPLPGGDRREGEWSLLALRRPA